MKRLWVPLLLTVLGWPHPGQAAGNLLSDGGGEPVSGMAGFAEANRTFSKVTARIAQARAKGLDVLYWQAAAIPMRVGLNERWKSFPEERPDTLRYVEKRGQELIREIDDVLAGKVQPRQVAAQARFHSNEAQGPQFL